MGILTKKFGYKGTKGELGEKIFQVLIKRFYPDCEVIDYTKSFKHQRAGIDFGIKRPQWRHILHIDVKNNLKNHDNPNVCLELEKNGKPGWLFTSHSTRIFHVDTTDSFDLHRINFVYYDLAQMRLNLLKMIYSGQLKPVEYTNKNPITNIKSEDLLAYIEVNNPIHRKNLNFNVYYDK